MGRIMFGTVGIILIISIVVFGVLVFCLGRYRASNVQQLVPPAVHIKLIRAKYMLVLSSVLLSIKMVGLFVAIGMFFYAGSSGTEFRDMMTKEWKDKVASNPSQVCDVQDAMRCSGFTVSCITSPYPSTSVSGDGFRSVEEK
eukprot:gene58033-biopygen120542